MQNEESNKQRKGQDRTGQDMRGPGEEGQRGDEASKLGRTNDHHSTVMRGQSPTS